MTTHTNPCESSLVALDVVTLHFGRKPAQIPSSHEILRFYLPEKGAARGPDAPVVQVASYNRTLKLLTLYED